VEWRALANHGGIYSWRLCEDANNPTEDCFKKNTLEIVGGSGKGPDGKWKQAQDGTNKDKVKLPNISCDPCIISWRLDGEWEKTTFINCADVRISGNGDSAAPQWNQVGIFLKFLPQKNDTIIFSIFKNLGFIQKYFLTHKHFQKIFSQRLSKSFFLESLCSFLNK